MPGLFTNLEYPISLLLTVFLEDGRILPDNEYCEWLREACSAVAERADKMSIK